MTLHIVLASLASLAVGIVLGVLLRRRRNTAQGRAAFASLEELDRTIQTLQQNLTEQRAETERTRAQRDEEARKAREYFERIDGIVTEANECRRLLVRTGAEHGNAQAMMLAEIDSLAIQYSMLAQQYREATGKPPQRPQPRMNAAIQVVAADFREAHVVPYQKPPTPAPSEMSPPSGG